MKDINILQSNILDIIFDGRNKEYGAYELRTNYQKRLFMSVMGMIVGCAALLLIYSIASGHDNSNIPPPVETATVIINPIDDEPEKPVEIEKPKPVPPVAMEKFVTPLITTEEIKPEDEVPDMEQLEDVKIGPVDQVGEKDDGIVAPPVEGVKDGVIEAPKKADADEDAIHLTVQIEAEYPGGISAWQRYLNRTFRYPDYAIENLIAGTVVVQFVVDKEGNVTDVEAISGPDKGGLREEAVRVIKKSGKWTPAIQNGRQVKSYKKQPVTFVLPEE
jgi:periplasmic protein TonB